jgi:hypothetical protein
MIDSQKITTADLKRLLIDVYRRFRGGLIDANQAKQETLLLTSCLDAVAVEETSERVKRLSDILRGA